MGGSAVVGAEAFRRGSGFATGPIYVRGLVYLHSKKGPEAAAEFQRILNYRALGAIAPAYALSQVGLVRALTRSPVTPPRAGTFIRTSSRSGRMPTLTFPSSRKLRRSMQDCSKAQRSRPFSQCGNGWRRKASGSLTDALRR